MLQPLSSQSFSTAFIASALGVSPQAVVKRARKKGWKEEGHKTQGGGSLWHFADLDQDAKAAVTIIYLQSQPIQQDIAATAARDVYLEAQWELFEQKTTKSKDRAVYRYEILYEAWQLHQHGVTLAKAFALVANQHGESVGNIRNWYFGTSHKQGVRGVDPKDWLPILADNYRGRIRRAHCDEKAWEFILKDYMRREQPSFAMCYERLERVAAEQNWVIPSERTLRRRLSKRHAPAEIAYARKGNLQLAYPYLERNRNAFIAGEAVAGDALNFDSIYVVHEDTGEIFTPRVWCFEDIYSGKILAWESDVSENSDMFRKAFYNLTDITLPRWMTIDNTRAASNIGMGGQLPRNRFASKDTEPVGFLKMFGVDVHHTNPDKDQTSSGSNPIERAFGIGGLHRRMRAWPAFIGRGTSMKKPIPYAEFLAALPQVVAEHNAKTGRVGGVCNGKSFNEVFAASFQESTARKPSETMRSLLLLSQEVARVAKDGTVSIKAGKGLTKHRYYSDVLAHYTGEYVSVMFNPDSLSDAARLYDLNGKFLGIAEWMPSVAFNDTETARRHAKQRARRNKAVKKSVAAAQAMSNDEFAMLNASVPASGLPIPQRLNTMLSDSEVQFRLSGKVSQSRQQQLHENLQKNIAARHSDDALPFAIPS